MDSVTFSAVILAAAMHAGWNAMIKVRLEPLLAMALIAVACGVLALPALVITGWPARASWPWMLTSVALHIAYYVALAGGYKRAEMSQIYPIARGGAPMLTALIGVLVLGERLLPVQALAVLILGSGIMMISLAGRRSGAGIDPVALRYAAATAVIICGYTLVDGQGARAANDPHAYSAALFVLEAMPLPLYILWRRGRSLLGEVRPFIWHGLFGGALSLASYWIAIWAMTRAPIPLVAAARESSVLFAVAIAYFILKEKIAWPRVAASIMIVLALALLRLT